MRAARLAARATRGAPRLTLRGASTVSEAEVAKFGAVVWADPTSASGAGPLHALNPARADYVRARAGGLRGKRVAVVGTGASAIQFVPGIVDDVAAMTVFQRSAPYILPKPDQAYHGALAVFVPRNLGHYTKAINMMDAGDKRGHNVKEGAENLDISGEKNKKSKKELVPRPAPR